MSTYYVDFSGWCKVEADSANEAIDKFWECIQNDTPLPRSLYYFEGVEEVEETTN